MLIIQLANAICAWGGFYAAADVNRINFFPNRLVKYGYLSAVVDFLFYLNQADTRLFKSITRSHVYCLQTLLYTLKPTAGRELRKRNHMYTLPAFRYELFRKSFLLRCLYSS